MKDCHSGNAGGRDPGFVFVCDATAKRTACACWRWTTSLGCPTAAFAVTPAGALKGAYTCLKQASGKRAANVRHAQCRQRARSLLGRTRYNRRRPGSERAITAGARAKARPDLLRAACAPGRYEGAPQPLARHCGSRRGRLVCPQRPRARPALVLQHDRRQHRKEPCRHPSHAPHRAAGCEPQASPPAPTWTAGCRVMSVLAPDRAYAGKSRSRRPRRPRGCRIWRAENLEWVLRGCLPDS